MILAAGIGQRLRPLTDDRPKALVRVGSESMLARATRLLIAHGVQEIVVATGYREDAIRVEMASCEVPVHYCRNEAFDTTQNSVSLLRCAHAVAGRSFYKLDGDVLFHPDVLGRLDAACAPLAVAVDASSTLGAEEMKVRVDSKSTRIRAFGKGLAPFTCFGESIGIERIGDDVVVDLFHALRAAYEAGKLDLYYEDVYGQLIDRGLDARAVETADLPWIEVDTAEDLDRAARVVSSGGLDRPLST